MLWVAPALVESCYFSCLFCFLYVHYAPTIYFFYIPFFSNMQVQSRDHVYAVPLLLLYDKNHMPIDNDACLASLEVLCTQRPEKWYPKWTREWHFLAHYLQQPLVNVVLEKLEIASVMGQCLENRVKMV